MNNFEKDGKEVRLSVRIDSDLKKEFMIICDKQDKISSKVIRSLIENWVNENKARQVIEFVDKEKNPK